MAKVMEKKVKKPVSKPKKPVSKPLDDASLKIETPYPKEEKKIRQKTDIDYWGEKMVKLQDRINELELTVNSMHLRLDKVANRLGM